MLNIATRMLVRALLLAAVFVSFLAAGPAAAQVSSLATIPPLTGHVIDTSLTLGGDARASLEAKLAAFEARKGSQLVVLIVPSTQPEDVAAFANRVAQQWKLGRKEVGDGILVVVATADRRARIEVARKLEGAVPDLAARQVVQEIMGPAFKTGDYAGGLIQGLDALIGLVDGEALPPPKAQSQRSPAGQSGTGGSGGFDLQSMAIFFFAAVFIGGNVLRGMFGRAFGSLLTAGATGGAAWWLTTSLLLGVGAGFLALVFSLFFAASSALSGLGRGRSGPTILGGGGFGGGFGSGGGGGGGGFSSGGGGSFGGGGASGDW